MKIRKKRKETQSPFATYAVADPQEESPESGTTIPSEIAVEDAKDWVDHHQI